MGQIQGWKVNTFSFSPHNNPSVSVVIIIVFTDKGSEGQIILELAWGQKEWKQKSRDLNLTF